MSDPARELFAGHSEAIQHVRTICAQLGSGNSHEVNDAVLGRRAHETRPQALQRMLNATAMPDFTYTVVGEKVTVQMDRPGVKTKIPLITTVFVRQYLTSE